MATKQLSYTAAQIDAAIAKVNSLITYISGAIVQLYDGSTAIYPRTKAEAVFFDNDTSKNLADEFSTVKSDITGIQKSKINASSIAPAWASSTAYVLNQRVTYEGVLYKCTTAHTSGSTWDSTKWTAEPVQTQINGLGDRLDFAEKEVIYDVSAHNDNAVFESLSALLNNANLNTLIPPAVRCGGMSIRFRQGSVPNSDNKYVQYRLMSDTFNTTIGNWQSLNADEEPVANSNNLVKSGGVAKQLDDISSITSYNKVKSGSMTSSNWEADLVCSLRVEQSYTLYKLDTNGYPVNVGARIKLRTMDNSFIETLKSDYNGFFGFTFTPNISSDGDYKLHLEFTSAQSSDYYERFMLVEGSVTIIYTQQYQYEEWNPKRSIILPDNSISSQQLKDNIISPQKISNNAIITSKIADSAVTKDKLGNSINQIYKLNSPNYVISSQMTSANWEALLSVYIFKDKTYTLYKLNSEGYPVNVGARVTLRSSDGSTLVKTIKSDYTGFFGLQFNTNDLSADGNYQIKLEFTAAQASDYDKRFMLVDKYVTIDNQQTYEYQECVEVYSILIPNNYVKEDNLTQNVLATVYGFTFNKVHLSFGDSITEQALWQSTFRVFSKTSAEIIKGYSGQALWSNCKLSVLQSKIGSEVFDFATVMFGTNDWGQSRQIGTITDTNPNGEYTGTFMGSLNTFFENFVTLFPNKPFVYVTPPFGSEDEDYQGNPFTEDGTKNLLGLTIRDYADAIIQVAKKWNIPCFDMNAVCGWNKINKTTYLTADANGTYIHPNSVGATRYARKLAFYCKSL